MIHLIKRLIDFVINLHHQPTCNLLPFQQFKRSNTSITVTKYKTANHPSFRFSSNVLFYTPYHNNRTQVRDAGGSLVFRPMWIKDKFDPLYILFIYTTNWFKGIYFIQPKQTTMNYNFKWINYKKVENIYKTRTVLKQNLSMFGMWQQ